MKKIPLTQAQFAIVDDEDYEWLMQWKWFAHWSPLTKSYYAGRNSPWKHGKRHMVKMHREILDLQYGDKRQGHHINHNTLDNRGCNVRIVSQQENKQNQRCPAGYVWAKWCGKFWARIGVNHRNISLGLYDDAQEAHEAYLKAKAIYHQIGV